MDFRFKPSGYTAFWLMCLVGCTNAQVPPARAILGLPEAEQVKFVNETIDAGLPDDRADQMTMLIINRSALVLPLLERRVEAELRFESPSKDLIAMATEMIAYAGNEEALRAISKLIAIDDARFGQLVERTLDNALDFRNPFTVAYRGFDMGDEALFRRIGMWADSRLASQRMQRWWAEALLDRYGRTPGETEWAKDPIASWLKSGASSELRTSVLRFATEAQRKRERR